MPWRYSGAKKTIATDAVYWRNAAAVASRTEDIRKRASGNSGSGVRCSCTAKSTRKTTAAAMSAQAHTPPRLTPMTSSASPRVPDIAPAMSNGTLVPTPSGSPDRVIASTIAPRATENHSTDRQPRNSVSTPPRSIPPLKLAAPTAAYTPSARPRLGPSGNTSVSRASAAGPDRAAPMPWTARAPSSTAPFGASAPTSAASVNSATPASKTRRLPNTSANRPPTSRNPANVTE